MTFRINSPLVGNQQIALFGLPDTTQRHPTGVIVPAVDAYWGGAEVMYCYAQGTIRMGGLVRVLPTAQTAGIRHEATEVANTANLGHPVGWAMTSATVGQYLWVMVSGVMPINCTASVAADTAFGLVAAGQCGAIANGKQITSARSILAAAATIVKVGQGVSGSKVIQVSGDAGWFIGGYLSGTGVGASALITDIDTSGTQVTASVANSAAINGNITCTYNNATIYYNVAHFNRPFAQGQVS